ncbi:hypothetical protein [Methylophilus methylotrophus]|uniref:hypothetical protein n=1 Tax=Methylophilus methylotrophus TaxID=17 RepID=UPI00036D0E50|nr:hypothetical protein [Methylophilus methylotrophus]
MAFNIATGLHAVTIIPNKLASHPPLIALIFFADISEQTKAAGKDSLFQSPHLIRI